MNFFLLILFFGYSSAHSGLLKNTTGASINPSDLLSCMEQSVQGNNEGKCARNGESNQCVGLKRALEDYEKNTKCFQNHNGVCVTYGHLQNTQMRWLSTAAGHLAVFHFCIDTHYGKPDQNNFSPALDDPNFVEFLRKIDDGSSVFGLENGTILKRSLSGAKLGTIIANSPGGKKIPEKDIASMKDSANNPIVVDLENIEEVGGSNPATEGDNWNSLRPAFMKYYESQGASVSLPTPAAPKEVTDPVRSPATESINPNYVYKKFSENPYSLGLDRGLFDRVSSAYHRKARSLQGLDDYVNAAKSTPDIKAIIKKGEGFEL